MNEGNPLLSGPIDPWYGSHVQAGYDRMDLGQQLAAAQKPDRFVHGDAMYGWTISDTRPEYDNLTWGKQNFLRMRRNDLENPRGLLGDNQAYIDEVQNLIDQGRGEFDAWKNSGDALRQFIPFASSREDDLAPILTAVDPDWNGMTEWNDWKTKNPEVAEYLTTTRGIVPEEAFSYTKNRDAFMLIINLEMTKAQIQQEVNEYEQHAGTYEKWTQFIGGGAFRQVLMDSDGLKTFALGGIGKGVGLGTKGLSWGLAATKLVAPAGRTAKVLGIVGRAGEAQGIHNVLAKNLRLGTAGALATEGFATGALWDAQHQSAMIEHAEWLGQSDLEYDFGDSFKAGALGALFGLSLYGGVRAVGGLANRKVSQRAAASAEALKAAGLADSPLTRHGLTPEGITLQRLEEDGMVKINRALNQIADERLGFLLSKDVVEASGRSVADAGVFVESLTALRKRGIRLSDDAMVELVDDFLNQGQLQKVTAAEKVAIEVAIAREELLRVKQTNPVWRAQQETKFAKWQDVTDRLDAAPDGPLTVEGLNSLLEGTGLRVNRSWTKAEAQDFARRQMVEIDSVLNTPANPVSAAAAVAPSLSLEDALGITGYSPRSMAGRLVNDIRRNLTLIDEQMKLGGKKSGTAVKAAKDEVKKLTASLNDLYGKAPAKPRVKKAKVPTAPALDRMTPAEQQKALNDIFDSIQSSPNEVLEAHTYMSKALAAVGYEGPLKRFLLNRTGIYSTARSKLKVVREAVMLFGSPDFNSRAFGNRGGAGVGIVSAMGRAERDVSNLKGWLEAFANRKGMTDEIFQDFNRTVESAMNRKARMPAGHAFEREGNEFISQFQKYVDDVEARGRRTKSIRPSKEAKRSTFLPAIVNEPYVLAHFNEAVDDLMGVWHKQAQGSEFLNPEYLEKLGWIERPVDRYGNRAGAIIYKDTSPLTGYVGKKFPKRSDLTPEALALYEAAIASPEPLRGSAQTYWSRFLGQEVRGGDVRSINDKVYGANGRSPHKRKITQRMLEDHPELKQYFNRDLFTMIDRYAKTAGFRSHIGESIQRAYGVNATLSQVMNALEARMAVEFKGDPDILREITESFDKAHEMVSWLGGFLPDRDPSYAAWGKYSADLLGKTGFLLSAGGIGLSNSYEALTKMFLMNHSAADFGRNVKALIRGLFGDRSVLREELAGLAHDSRRMAVGYSHQLFSNRMDHAFELTTRGALTRPWRDAWDVAMGNIKPGDGVNRVASTALSTMDALGKTAYIAGAGPRITHATQVMVSGAAQREFMRYSDAVIKLRGLMEASPIDASDINAGTKEFKALARKAGFGDRWDLAEKYIRWDLSAPGVVESLQAAAAQVKVRNRIHVKNADLIDVYASMPTGPEKAQLYEAMQRYGQYVDDRIAEELAETTAWSARTDSRARTHWGRALDMFTSYMHNTYFHKLGKSSSMPSRVFLGVVSGLVVTELLTMLSQEYLNGASVDDMVKKWDSPEEALLSTLSGSMRIPVFGAVSFVPKYIGDSAIDTFNTYAGNDPLNPYQPNFGGVVGGGVDTVFRFGKGINQWAFGLTPEVNERGQKTTVNSGMRFIPIINSAYGKAAVRTFTDWKERQPIGSQRTLNPVGDGRSIWGDEDAIVTEATDPTTPESSGFDLAKALTDRK